MCKCESAGQHLYFFDYDDNRISIVQNGRYIQIFDDVYPGFSDAFPINYCPICGRKLTEDIEKAKEAIREAGIADCAPASVKCDDCQNEAFCDAVAAGEDLTE